MKKLILSGLALTVIVLSTLAGCIYEVRTPPPAARVEVRPVQPYRNAVWVGGYWNFKHGNWVWASGYWQRRPGPNAVWVPGHWKQTRRGWKRVPGHWRR